jgi:hypothetical protein
MLNLKKDSLYVWLSMLFTCLVNGQENGLDNSSFIRQENAPAEKAIFVVHSSIRDIETFRAFASQIARLRPFGRIDMYINSTAEKADFEMPQGGSPWHEYAAYDRSLSKFFPDEMVAPFIPEELVKKNRQLLLSKVKIIRDLGLNAGYRANEPHFLPEAFFESYPHLRGPRVDHPRRSLQKEFAPCFHQQETRDMYQRMVNTLFKNVPEIHTVHLNMNDAGSGFCWAEWLYSGPNGPVDCKDLSMSERVINLVNIFKNGAGQTGHDIDIFMWGMYTDSEIEDIVSHLPDNCFIRGVEKGNFPPMKNIGSIAGSAYPVRGIINPYGILRTLNRNIENMPQRYSLGFGGAYDRGTERLETVEKVIDIVEDHLANQAEEGLIPTLQVLQKLCVEWAGEESADRLFKAFVDLDEALKLKQTAIGGLSTLYWGVSTRHITRPLVIAPERLSPAEEAYFLPHVFNVSMDEARSDYMDIHGGGHNAIPMASAGRFLSALKKVYTSMEKITNAPEQEFLDNMAMALRIYSSVVRSCANFNDAQIIRNRNREVLAGPIHRPNKIPTWTGDQDLLDFNQIMRDELDNTTELIELLENGGMDLINHASDPALEDTFLLGPDLIENLKQKRKIMLDHWLDIEGYMTSPFK